MPYNLPTVSFGSHTKIRERTVNTLFPPTARRPSRQRPPTVVLSTSTPARRGHRTSLCLHVGKPCRYDGQGCPCHCCRPPPDLAHRLLCELDRGDTACRQFLNRRSPCADSSDPTTALTNAALHRCGRWPWLRNWENTDAITHFTDHLSVFALSDEPYHATFMSLDKTGVEINRVRLLGQRHP